MYLEKYNYEHENYVYGTNLRTYNFKNFKKFNNLSTSKTAYAFKWAFRI